MGLAIDGNEVHGIAKGGQAFVSIGNANNKDESLNIGGHDYLSKNKMKITSTDSFDVSINEGSATIDVTDKLSNYGGCLAICVIYTTDSSVSMKLIIPQPIIIPTAPTTGNLSFDDSNWSGSLSKTTDNNFTFVFNYTDSTSNFPNIDATGRLYILSNN